MIREKQDWDNIKQVLEQRILRHVISELNNLSYYLENINKKYLKTTPKSLQTYIIDVFNNIEKKWWTRLRSQNESNPNLKEVRKRFIEILSKLKLHTDIYNYSNEIHEWIPKKYDLERDRIVKFINDIKRSHLLKVVEFMISKENGLEQKRMLYYLRNPIKIKDIELRTIINKRNKIYFKDKPAPPTLRRYLLDLFKYIKNTMIIDRKIQRNKFSLNKELKKVLNELLKLQKYSIQTVLKEEFYRLIDSLGFYKGDKVTTYLLTNKPTLNQKLGTIRYWDENENMFAVKLDKITPKYYIPKEKLISKNRNEKLLFIYDFLSISDSEIHTFLESSNNNEQKKIEYIDKYIFEYNNAISLEQNVLNLQYYINSHTKEINEESIKFINAMIELINSLMKTIQNYKK